MTREAGEPDPKAARAVIARAFTLVEDVVYIGIGVLLALSAAMLLVNGAVGLWRASVEGAPLPGVINLLDRTLLVLMLVELLYTVQVSFRAHALKPEPFLVVGLIAAVRRILVVTAEFSHMAQQSDAVFHRGLSEIGLLTALALALVVSLWMLRTRPAVEGGAEEPPPGPA